MDKCCRQKDKKNELLFSSCPFPLSSYSTLSEGLFAFSIQSSRCCHSAPSYSAALFQLWRKDKDKQIPKYELQVLISDFNHLTGPLKSDLNLFFGASAWLTTVKQTMRMATEHKVIIATFISSTKDHMLLHLRRAHQPWPKWHRWLHQSHTTSMFLLRPAHTWTDTQDVSFKYIHI